jgi:hypothetical protein
MAPEPIPVIWPVKIKSAPSTSDVFSCELNQPVRDDQALSVKLSALKEL